MKLHQCTTDEVFLFVIMEKKILFFLLFFSSLFFGQTKVGGKVVDEKNEPIAYANVVLKGSKDGVITDLAVMRKMHIRHHPIVVTESRYPNVLHRTTVKGTKLANRISIAYLKTRRLARIFFILWWRAD